MSARNGGYTVGQVAAQAGVSAQTIREWERLGHLSAYRTPGGQRRFTSSTLVDACRLAVSRRRTTLAPLPSTSSAEDIEQARTGARIRAARLRAGLSQEQVARLVGVSRSFISTVERGQSGLSVHTLAALADLFRIPLSGFAPSSASTAVVRRAERPLTKLAGGVVWEELAHTRRSLEPALLRVPPGETSGGLITRPGETFVLVLGGALHFMLGSAGHTIRVGVEDSVSIDAASAYGWANHGHEPAVCVWVEHLPGVGVADGEAAVAR